MQESNTTAAIRQALRNLIRRMPMPLLALLVGLLAGLALWQVIDAAQYEAVANIYDTQLQENLDQRSREALIHFNHLVDGYESTVRLLANHRSMTSYLEPLYWFADDPAATVLYEDQLPPWMPEAARWERLISPSHILLLDMQGKIREEYRLQKAEIPTDLTPYLARLALDPRGFMVELDDSLFLLATTAAEDATGNVMGSLTLVVPIDGDFLRRAQRVVIDDVFTALIDTADDMLISSSNPEDLPAGINMASVMRDYAITTQTLTVAGDAASAIVFATLMPRSSVEAMRRSVMSLERQQRLIMALGFIVFFSLLFALVSSRLSKALRRLNDFSQRALGFEQPALPPGNQLLVLEDWTKQFITLVREAREEMRALHEIERQRQEMEIRSLEAFPAESPSPMLRVNRDGLISYANEASRTLLEFWHCEPAQKLPREWRHYIDRALLTDTNQQTELAVGEAIYTLLFSPIKELGYVNIYGLDVTEARQAEERARYHQNELLHVARLSSMGEMATGLAHELNQPLAAIINYANGAKRRFAGGASGEELSEPLEQITAQATRAAQIIKWLRGLVERQSPSYELVDANSMIAEVLSFMDFEIRKVGVNLRVDYGTELPLIYVDLVQIEQVLLNLLRNALDAVADNAAQKDVVIMTALRDDQVEIEIRDNGHGMDEETRQRLFEPFYTTKSTGMGMGLAISQTILEQHRASIRVDSLVGRGTRFTLSFPAQQTEQKRA